MRRQSLVASAVLTVVLALVALPGVAGSQTASPVRPFQAEALQSVRLPASVDGSHVVNHLMDAAGESAGHLDATTSLIEPGISSAPTERPAVVQPVPGVPTVAPPKPKAEEAAGTGSARAVVPTPKVEVVPKLVRMHEGVPGPQPTVKPGPADMPWPAVRLTTPGTGWKRAMSGLASWYDNGATAMRLPPGTHIKICGVRGCVVRVVRDWGPASYLSDRIVDMTPWDFVAVTGRSLKIGLAPVKVYIY